MIRDSVEIEYVREEYAKTLEDLARQIRENDKLPEAFFLQMYWTNGEVSRVFHCSGGFHSLRAVGTLEVIKTQIVNNIVVAESDRL